MQTIPMLKVRVEFYYFSNNYPVNYQGFLEGTATLYHPLVYRFRLVGGQ